MTDAETAALEQLQAASETQREVEFDDAKVDIRNQIVEALAERVWGEQAKQLASLRGDRQYEEAVKILKDQAVYKQKMKLALADDSN